MKAPTLNSSRTARTRFDRSIHKAIASLLLFSTATTFAAPPGDYAAAGRAQGAQDATGEAKRLGRIHGLEDGKNRGYRDGYDGCADQMRQEARRNGERQGDRDGTIRASQDGSTRGIEDGQAKGAGDGDADGNVRSDRQARADATPKGTVDGIAEANRTDAAARGAADGKVAGDASAKADANANEYQPARDQYKNERYSETIRSEGTIHLGAPSTAAITTTAPAGSAKVTKRSFSDTKTTSTSALIQARIDAVKLVQSATLADRPTAGPGDPPIPDVKPTQAAEKAIAYCKANTSTVALVSPTKSTLAPQPRPSGSPRPLPSTTPSPIPAPTSEFEKCVDTYKPAYEQGFLSTFKTEYVATYKLAYETQYRPYQEQGCREARKADYRRDYDQAYRRSFDETYRLVFDQVYRTTFDKAYREMFATASAESYDRNYPGHYDVHYAAAKAKAFEARKDQLYAEAFHSAKAAEYATKYPGYKKIVVARGRADEADEFARIPVRLIGIAMKESIKDGVQEPGEKLTVDMDLRNFAETPITANEIDIRAVAKTAGVAIPGSVAILTKGLAAKSLTHVIGALDVRLDESALGKTALLEIQISVRGNRLATETIKLTAKTLTTLALLETPVVRLGYPGSVRVRVTNQSSLALPENATLGLTTNMQGVVFSKSSDAVDGLRAGEARDVSFPFNADNYQDGQQVKFVASLNLASGRRIGLLNESREVPSIQDYQFRMSGSNDNADLRKKGKERMKIAVKNVSSRQATETLTLTVSITGPNAANFQFVKGNQMAYSPIAPGQESDSDKIVINSRKENSGGTLVFEVREGGRLLGITRQNF